jgi:hypothetical protein
MESKFWFIGFFVSMFLLVGATLTSYAIVSDSGISWQTNQTDVSNLGASLRGAIAYYSFNNAPEGTYVKDDSIWNNFGELNGTTYNSSCDAYTGSGGCYEFDGINDYISVSDLNLDLSEITISLWSKPNDDSSTDTDRLICMTDSLGAEMYDLVRRESDKLLFAKVDDSNNVLATGVLGSGWEHIVMVYNGSGGAYYVNGVRVADMVAGDEVNNISNIFIGIKRGPSAFFNGSIDEVIILDKSIEESEVQELYNARVGKYNKQGDWKSFVFHNNTDKYWNITQSIADTYSDKNKSVLTTNTGIDLNEQTLELDGDDDYISVPDNFNFGSALTVSGWFKKDVTDLGDTMISQYDTGANKRSFRLYGEDGTRYYVVLSNDGTYTSGHRIVFRSDNDVFPVGVWTHITFTWDGSDLKAYTNGILQSGSFTYNEFDGDIYNSDADLTIGSSLTNSIPATFFPGSIDETLIFNRTLSASEVTDLYNKGFNLGDYDDSGLVAKYEFDGDFTDSKGSNDGTANGGAYLGGPVAYWDLDSGGSESDPYADEMGVNDGTPTGTNNATGISSGAMMFDGVDDYINVSTDIIGTGADSVCSWIYPTSFDLQTGNNPFIMGNGKFYFWIRGATNDIGVRSDGTNTANSEAGSIALNSWYHVCVSRDNTGSSTNIYVNGKLSGTANQDSGTPTAGNYDLLIGNAPNIATRYFSGSIDEVIIYNKTISANEISQLYKAGLSQHANTNITLETRTATDYNVSDSDLVGLWGLNSNESGVAVDETGINNGTWNDDSKPLDEAGVVGMGGDFDGSGDYIGVSDNFDFGSALTVSVWANKFAGWNSYSMG